MPLTLAEPGTAERRPTWATIPTQFVVFRATRRSRILFSATMPMSYTQFLTQVATALHEEDGLTLAFLIRPTSPHGKDLVKEFRNPTVRRILPA